MTLFEQQWFIIGSFHIIENPPSNKAICKEALSLLLKREF